VPCYHPVTAYRSLEGRNSSGAWPIVFNVKRGYHDLPVTVPCGRCIGCRLERSRQWAVRCVNEAQMYERNSFVTLTYNDSFVKLSLDKRDFVLFMKRLRKKYGDGIRFFHCGEYGEQLQRPHHHVCLFNHDFPDKILWSVRESVRLYVSPDLQRLWPYGYSTIGDVTFESAAYVARYITKKITGEIAADHYQGRLPEYITMSRRPGIGRPWLEKHLTDVYPGDKLVVRDDLICKPPRYYDNIFDNIDKIEMEEIKRKRRMSAKLHSDDNTYERLAVKEIVKLSQFKKLKRGFENDC